MDRINSILQHELFVKYINEIELKETDRKFCLHGLNHALDVARIAYIIDLEEKLGYKRDVIYAMALLHDLGRAKEYADGSNHHQAGAQLAAELLKTAGFWKAEIEQITAAILNHKCDNNSDKTSLSYILYKADKLSRNCFACSSYEECYWSENLKNKIIDY